MILKIDFNLKTIEFESEVNLQEFVNSIINILGENYKEYTIKPNRYYNSSPNWFQTINTQPEIVPLDWKVTCTGDNNLIKE